MEDVLVQLFGDETEITPWQMSLRMILIFIIALILIRISGRRSFGMSSPLDNVVTILIGGILTRGVDGRTPFLGVIAAAVTFVILYRIVNWACVHNKTIGKLVKGEEKIIFKDGKLDKERMKKYMITEKDMEERLRITLHEGSLENIKEAYIERDGEIGLVKKEQQ
jgi:uncharacterized membrane protein YcaP (DUF421 family)